MSHPMTDLQHLAVRTSYSPRPIVTLHRASTMTTVVLPLMDGTLTISDTSTDRTTFSASLPMSWAPLSWTDPLVPADTYLTIEYDVGVDDPIRVGLVWLDQVQVRRPEGRVSITASTRSKRVSQAGFAPGDRFYTGTCTAVVQRIVNEALGITVPCTVQSGLPVINVDPTEAWTGDPWNAVEQLMDRIGGEAFFDEYDELILRPTPRFDPVPVFELKTGEDGNIIDYTINFERAANRQAVIFNDPTGSQADIVGIASATGNAAWDGPYGRYRREESRSGKVTQAQANAAAATLLTRTGGALRSVDLTIAPTPFLDAGDCVSVQFANEQTETHWIRTVNFPLTPGNAETLVTASLPWDG